MVPRHGTGSSLLVTKGVSNLDPGQHLIHVCFAFGHDDGIRPPFHTQVNLRQLGCFVLEPLDLLRGAGDHGCGTIGQFHPLAQSTRSAMTSSHVSGSYITIGRPVALRRGTTLSIPGTLREAKI